MLHTLANKRLICMALIVSFLALSGISHAASLSMMLEKNDSAITSSIEHQMPCHQAEQDTVAHAVCKGCVDCHFCMIASAQLISATTKTNFLSHVGLTYPLAHASNTYSKDYPPAIRPPIV